ncbi:hypothetical protein ACEWY4_020025 [Coilia grayii]|uniref:Transmembrane protein n=1 Tax=Coilia grayii TaxID=363190 RepID=A0ABD1JBR6_9TELE
MSPTVDMVGSDLMAPKLPAEGSSEMAVKTPAGNSEAGDAHTLIQDLDRKEADKQQEEKRGRKKDEEKEKKKKKRGWCAKLMSCFVCGGASQDKWEMLEEERLRVQERIRKAREADLQRFLKLRKVNLMCKQAFKRMQRCRKMVEANKEWSALPLQSEEAERKVTFREVDACDVWFYQDEANPRLGQVWKRVLVEIRGNKMGRALQEKWVEEEEQLMKREEKHIASQRQEAVRSQSYCSKLVATSLLCLGIGAFVWFLLQ